MDEFKSRLEFEILLLNHKILEITKLIESEKYYDLSRFEKKLLLIQKSIMTSYMEVLNMRLKLLNN